MMKFGLVLLAAVGASAEMGDPTSYYEKCSVTEYQKYVTEEIKAWAKELDNSEGKWDAWSPFGTREGNETQAEYNENFLLWGDNECAKCGIKQLKSQTGNKGVYPEHGGMQGVEWVPKSEVENDADATTNDVDGCQPNPQECAKTLTYYMDGTEKTCNKNLKDATKKVIHNKCYFRWRNSHTKAVMNWIDSIVDSCTDLNWVLVAAVIGVAIVGSVTLLIILACCIQTFKKPKTQEKLA